MKQYSAPKLSDVILHTEQVMQTVSGEEVRKGTGKVGGAGFSTNDKGLGTDIWNDKENEE